MISSALVALIALYGTSGQAMVSGPKPDKVFIADGQKSSVYLKEGLVIGGDQAIDQVTVSGLRYSKNPGFERMVIDIDGIEKGNPAALSRPPYYQVSIANEMRRLVFTIWGNPKLGFSANKVVSAFKKSHAIQKVELLPLVEKDRWTFVVDLKNQYPVEVFELNNPVRIIVDIKTKK